MKRSEILRRVYANRGDDHAAEMADAVSRWADGVGIRNPVLALAAWDAVIAAHGEGGTPQEIAARIDEIVRSYGGTPQGAAPDDAPQDPPDPDYDGPMIPTGGA